MKFVSSSRKIQLVVAVAATALFASCSGDKKKPPFELMPHMMDNTAVKAQHLGPFDEPMRTPPEGTISQTTEIYHYANDPEGAGRALTNPVPRDKQSLLQGQKMFNTYCMVCHGPRGEGNGTIVPKFPQPPSLHSDKVRGWSDGRIYHVITMGQNLMPRYSTQISPMDRWAIVNYVRVLQRANNPTDADLRELEAERAGR